MRSLLLIAGVLLAPYLAAMPLAAPPGPLDLPRLRELLYTHDQPAEQSQAALLLMEAGTPEALEIISEGLGRWDRPDVFQSLAGAVRLRKDARHVESLLKALACEQGGIRQAAVEALSRINSPILAGRLLAMGQDASAPLGSRQAAAAVLGRSMQKAAMPALLALLTVDAPAVRQAAGQALEEATGLSFGTDHGRWQVWWNQHKDIPEPEWHYAQALYLADRARRLEQDLQRAEGQVLRTHKMLYAKVAPADRPEHFRQLAQSEFPGLRAQIVTWILEALPEAGTAEQRQLGDILLALSEDGVESVGRQAVLALEKLDDPRVVERLLALLRSHSVNVRSAAARSLGRSRASKGAFAQEPGLHLKVIAALEKALSDPSITVVSEAAESLGSLGVPEAAPILAGLLRHSSEPIRQAAARALEQVASVRVLDSLYVGLEDPSASVRFSLLGALARIGASAALSEPQREDLLRTLRHMLVKDGDPGVRSRAATVLGDLGSAADLSLLWQRVQATEDNRVQLKAWTAMIEILSRSNNAALVLQWDQTLAGHKQPGRRLELLTETRNRWLKLEPARPQVDAVTLALCQVQLAQRGWEPAVPLALDLAKRAPAEADLRERVRLLLVAANQALEDDRPANALQIIKDAEEFLPRARDVGSEFDSLRRRCLQAGKK
jgi:HEAT repeat protein